MAWAALAATLVGTAMQVGGQMTQASAAAQAGQQQFLAKQFEADQLDQNAGQVEAAAQRQAQIERRQANLIASRALAIGGASGAGLSDPTMAGILTDIEAEGSYRAASAIYEGADRARRMRMGADAAMFEGGMLLQGGQTRSRAMRTAAVGTLLQGAGSLYGKYGMGGPKNSPSISSASGYYDAGTPLFNPYG